MPERVTKHVVTRQEIEDMQTAYDHLLVAEDITRKMREAGEPRPEQETKLRAMREKAERWSKAFDIPLEGP